MSKMRKKNAIKCSCVAISFCRFQCWTQPTISKFGFDDYKVQLFVGCDFLSSIELWNCSKKHLNETIWTKKKFVSNTINVNTKDILLNNKISVKRARKPSKVNDNNIRIVTTRSWYWYWNWNRNCIFKLHTPALSNKHTESIVINIINPLCLMVGDECDRFH